VSAQRRGSAPRLPRGPATITTTRTSQVPLFTRVDDLAEIVGRSIRQIRRWREQGIIPPPVHISPKRIAWPTAQIVAWAEAHGLARADVEAVIIRGAAQRNPLHETQS